MADYGLHKHIAIDLIPGRIRLLRVLPDVSDHGHVQCQIWNDTTDAKYTCLSYTWGPEHKKKDILVNGKLFQCRENLWDFLNTARERHDTTTKAFWIDAVCINQSNVFERNHQVSQMGHIYSSAASVLMWLGRSEDIARFLDFMQSMVATLSGSYDLKQVRKYWYQHKSRQTQSDWYAFLTCSYWTRAWITQEVLLSKEARVLAGNTEIGINELRVINKLLLEVEKQIPSGPDTEDTDRHARAIQLIKVYLRMTLDKLDDKSAKKPEKSRLGLLDLAFSLPGRGSQEPRDQIYSLRAIAQDGDNIRINYQISNQNCLLHTAKALRKNMCFCSLPFLARIFSCTPSTDDEHCPRFPDVTIALPEKTFPSQEDPKSLNWDKEWIVFTGSLCLHVCECALIIAKDGSNLRVCTKSSDEFTISISNLAIVTRKLLRKNMYVTVKRENVTQGGGPNPTWDNKPLGKVEKEDKLETILEISMSLDSWIRIASAFEADGPTRTELCSESRWGWDSPLSVGLGKMVLPAQVHPVNTATRSFQRYPMIRR